MKLNAAASLFLLAALVTGCTAVKGTGDVVTIDVPIENVSRLVISHSFEVNVTVDEEPSLTLRVDDNLNESLNVGMDGNTLLIGLEPGPPFPTPPWRLTCRCRRWTP